MSSMRREKYHAWTWGIAALIALALLWLWISGRGPGLACCNASPAVAAVPAAVPEPAATSPAVAPTATVPAVLASTPAPATASAPAAVQTVVKPQAKLYFATGKTSTPADTAERIADVVAYLKQNPSSKAVISGFNDSRGDPKMNAELSKNRAKSAREALKAAGVDEARIELRKPEDTNLAGDPKQARRVEISVEP
jgi:outer membrane protein OmpA-like peptidoglycan-associated protein